MTQNTDSLTIERTPPKKSKHPSVSQHDDRRTKKGTHELELCNIQRIPGVHDGS